LTPQTETHTLFPKNNDAAQRGAEESSADMKGKVLPTKKLSRDQRCATFAHNTAAVTY